jgi:hypothetical protein
MAVLKFRVFFEEDDTIYRDIAIKHNQSFFELHQALLAAYEFDSIHQASFYRSNDSWQRGRAIILEKYDNELEDLKRSLGEDLIFSYEVSKSHKLIYCPKAKILFQDPFLQHVDLRGKELKLYFYVMLYFVFRNKELSVFRFYIFQITRFLSSLALKGFSKQITCGEILEFLTLYMKSIRIIFSKNKIAFIKKQLSL